MNRFTTNVGRHLLMTSKFFPFPLFFYLTFNHHLLFSLSVFPWPSVALIPNNMKQKKVHLDTLFITNFQLRESDDSWLLYDRNSSTYLLSPSIHERQNSSLTSYAMTHQSTQISCSHLSSPKLGYCNQRSGPVVLGFLIYILIQQSEGFHASHCSLRYLLIS